MDRRKNGDEIPEIPLFFPRSTMSSAANKTGSWRYFRPLYEEKTAPCSAACPAGEDVPRIEMLTRQGLRKKAWETTMQENPFPSTCGRVCFHPCEEACNRGELDESIAIHTLERFIGDRALGEGQSADLQKLASNGRKIAIAGAGPAGLAAAYFLDHLGYQSDIFEAAPEPGGLLRWGIPGYRLPADVLKLEIARIEKGNTTIHCEKPVTRNLLQQLMTTHDAIFVGCGFSRPIQMKIQGEQLTHNGLRFLHDIRCGRLPAIEGTAAVIGGGNTAIDVARSLRRLGATPIIVYRRRKQDMPAFEPEVDMALSEDIALKELAAPIRIEKNDSDPTAPGKALSMTLQKMKVSARKIHGRARVIADGDITEVMVVNHIFMAIGAGPEVMWQQPQHADAGEYEMSHCKIIQGDVPLIFGGDLVNHTNSVTDAIASGKQAAMALDIYFQQGGEATAESLDEFRVGNGEGLSMSAYLAAEGKSKNPHIVSFDEINTDYFSSDRRVLPVRLEPDQRIRSFAETESTLSQDAAIKEAGRCFNCGICTSCDYCRIFCPEVAVMVEKAQRHINLDYCKGCGICVTECPRNAMAMEKEK
jgi:NADPH-dependent glutamate synthase beta subunit-like oxidoreductase